MLTTDLHYASAFSNPYLFGEAHLHDDAYAKEALSIILQKIINTLIAYALALKDFVDFVESSNHPSYLGCMFHIIMRMELEFIFIHP